MKLPQIIREALGIVLGNQKYVSLKVPSALPFEVLCVWMVG